MEKKEENKIPAHSPESSGVGGKHAVTNTYAEDMAKVLEDDKGGLIKKIIHQEEEREVEKRNLSPESTKNRLFMLVGILLIFTALAIFFSFFFKNDINTVDVPVPFTLLIFNDKTGFIEIADFSKDQITQIVRNAVNTTTVKQGGIEGIYLTENKKVVGFKRFIALIKGNYISANIGDSGNFIDNNFLMGVVNNETFPVSLEGKDFFILLKIRSVADIFDSMRVWENKMFSDLYGFFGMDISPETKYLLTKNFKNSIVQNKNARILYDNDNKIVMMYIFANDNSIIITDTENATGEIILRLASSQIKK
ncbi:hypothetical protein A3B85_02085 [Candidatus Nomurabacteria bacterium RIFCSPHIGHO2_02_FULL_37_13]|uniref:Uncharacterized protein n=1 Tax=Candidatus Nomurabacteria bacterium RIFCSPHIGHO2_02_FULL_37_13 TaxID=1801750 RepID=A0A1F6W5P5_9BACT|nr:MAG: hypothetical protein A3B85_02085 [Candidatus Nomurabacteria bacterium RIFCSPHIGHO2_02_FULL_37_13]OGI88433.1 MAG: hypothetical protein A2906_00805 [Candidatus Nomurabacteria bacterium RIFCSPLOWO2_01_FULL_37_25]